MLRIVSLPLRSLRCRWRCWSAISRPSSTDKCEVSLEELFDEHTALMLSHATTEYANQPQGALPRGWGYRGISIDKCCRIREVSRLRVALVTWGPRVQVDTEGLWCRPT
jgi:hypothetical protein